jgi:hypothetical protein
MTGPEGVKMLLELTKRSENDSSDPRVIKISESDSYEPTAIKIKKQLCFQ